MLEMACETDDEVSNGCTFGQRPQKRLIDLGDSSSSLKKPRMNYDLLEVVEKPETESFLSNAENVLSPRNGEDVVVPPSPVENDETCNGLNLSDELILSVSPVSAQDLGFKLAGASANGSEELLNDGFELAGSSASGSLAADLSSECEDLSTIDNAAVQCEELSTINEAALLASPLTLDVNSVEAVGGDEPIENREPKSEWGEEEEISSSTAEICPETTIDSAETVLNTAELEEQETIDSGEISDTFECPLAVNVPESLEKDTVQDDTLIPVDTVSEENRELVVADEADLSSNQIEELSTEHGTSEISFPPVEPKLTSDEMDLNVSDQKEEISEESSKFCALDEASLDGSSMKILDDLTSSSDGLLFRNSGFSSTNEGTQLGPDGDSPSSDDVDVGDSESTMSASEFISEDSEARNELSSSDRASVVAKMTRKELEETVMRKVAQSITDKNEVRSLLEIVKKKSAELAHLERKYQAVYKQMGDLAVVLKRYVSERRSNPNGLALPSKITRAVAVQVRLDEGSIPHSSGIIKPIQRRRAGRPASKKSTLNPSILPQPVILPMSTPSAAPSISPKKVVNGSASVAHASPVRPSLPPSHQVLAQSPVRTQPPPSNSPAVAPRVSTVVPPRVPAVGSPQVAAMPTKQPELKRSTPVKKISSPMVFIPPEQIGHITSGSPSTISTSTNTKSQQNSWVVHSQSNLSKQQHQLLPMRDTPVVAKVTLPSNVTEILEAQAAAQRASVAVRQVADDVIDLTDEDDTGMAVVQRSSSVTSDAKTLSMTSLIGNTIVVKKNGITTTRTSMSQAQSSSGAVAPVTQRKGYLQHPAPLPPSPPNPRVALHLAPPPRPKVSLTRKGPGICITWNMELLAQHADIKVYHIYVYQESDAEPSTSLWKYVGEIRALPLPIACTLKQFTAGHRYHFAVKAKDKFGRFGQFSDVVSIVLIN